MIRKIARFDGDFAFLSNFYPAIISMDGMSFLNAESAFQAQKCLNRQDRFQFCNLSPRDAKKLGRKVKLRLDWEAIKDQVMAYVLHLKFRQHPELGNLLIATGDAELIEGNPWRDTYWGVCDGVGKNRLGELLMQLRNELRQETGFNTNWR